MPTLVFQDIAFLVHSGTNKELAGSGRVFLWTKLVHSGLHSVTSTMIGQGAGKSVALTIHDGLNKSGAGGVWAHSDVVESFVTGVVNATTPAASVSNAPGPVTSASVPALVNLPTLVISTIGGQTVPSNPGGSYATADVTLPPGTTNPVTVTVTATNTTVPTTFSFKVLPPNAAAPIPVTATSTGSFASSTATASLTIPAGQTSVLQVYGDYMLP